MKNQNFSKIIKKEHINKWVALTPNEDRVVGYAPTPKKALKKAVANGIKKPVFTYVVKDYGNFFS
ncbi:MAG TPA: DUF5678 domain-containing protein [Candidatus Bathyarchaeia archaeon]|nr:DUF5678 domain-containing protein [Candidatus Bathyarchaeia archaeon]